MVELVLGLLVGLVVGWVALPEPQWVKNLYAKVFTKKVS